MKILLVLNTIIFIIILLINTTFALYNPKVYAMQTFDTADCTGEVKIQRTLWGSPLKYDFFFVWDQGYRTLNCDPKEIDSQDYNCSWSRVDCEENKCKTFFKINQCIDGNKLIYEKFNYLESKYCVVSEDRLVGSINVMPAVITILRNNYCYLNFACLRCTLLTFNLTFAQSGLEYYSNTALTIGNMSDPEFGYHTFYMFGDQEFHKGLGKSNFATNNEYQRLRNSSNEIINSNILILVIISITTIFISIIF